MNQCPKTWLPPALEGSLRLASCKAREVQEGEDISEVCQGWMGHGVWSGRVTVGFDSVPRDGSTRHVGCH